MPAKHFHASISQMKDSTEDCGMNLTIVQSFPRFLLNPKVRRTAEKKNTV